MCDHENDIPVLDDSIIIDTDSALSNEEPTEIKPIYLNSSQRLQETLESLNNAFSNFFTTLRDSVMPQLNETITKVTNRLFDRINCY